MRLLGQLYSPRDGARVVAEKRAEKVFLLLDSALEIGNGFCRSVHQLLRLPDVEHGGSSTVCQRLRELQRVLARSQRSPRDFELQVERTTLEVGCGNVTDQRADNRFACPLIGQQVCARRFGGAAILPPKIEIPGQREADLVRASVIWGQEF